MTQLTTLLNEYRTRSQTEREKGTYFEKLIQCYLRTEPSYADNLSKELPRIPCVKKATDFWAFSQAGRALAKLHIDYETVDMYPATIEIDGKVNPPQSPFDKGGSKKAASVSNPTLKKGEECEAFRGISSDIFRVEKMRHAKVKVSGKSVDDKTTLIYNDHIIVQGIPQEAYDYIVNGKPALAWVIERQCVKTDKDSGIVNDANRYATETMNNPRYPLELFLRVITVSLETMKIVNALPGMGI